MQAPAVLIALTAHVHRIRYLDGDGDSTTPFQAIVPLQMSPAFHPDTLDYVVTAEAEDRVGLRPVLGDLKNKIAVDLEGLALAHKEWSDGLFYFPITPRASDTILCRIAAMGAADSLGRVYSVRVVALAAPVDTEPVPPGIASLAGLYVRSLRTVYLDSNGDSITPYSEITTLPLSPEFHPDSLTYSVDVKAGAEAGILPILADGGNSLAVMIGEAAISPAAWSDGSSYFPSIPGIVDALYCRIVIRSAVDSLDRVYVVKLIPVAVDDTMPVSPDDSTSASKVSPRLADITGSIQRSVQPDSGATAGQSRAGTRLEITPSFHPDSLQYHTQVFGPRFGLRFKAGVGAAKITVHVGDAVLSPETWLDDLTYYAIAIQPGESKIVRVSVSDSSDSLKTEYAITAISTFVLPALSELMAVQQAVVYQGSRGGSGVIWYPFPSLRAAPLQPFFSPDSVRYRVYCGDMGIGLSPRPAAPSHALRVFADDTLVQPRKISGYDPVISGIYYYPKETLPAGLASMKVVVTDTATDASRTYRVDYASGVPLDLKMVRMTAGECGPYGGDLFRPCTTSAETLLSIPENSSAQVYSDKGLGVGFSLQASGFKRVFIKKDGLEVFSGFLFGQARSGPFEILPGSPVQFEIIAEDRLDGGRQVHTIRYENKFDSVWRAPRFSWGEAAVNSLNNQRFSRAGIRCTSLVSPPVSLPMDSEEYWIVSSNPGIGLLMAKESHLSAAAFKGESALPPISNQNNLLFAGFTMPGDTGRYRIEVTNLVSNERRTYRFLHVCKDSVQWSSPRVSVINSDPPVPEILQINLLGSDTLDFDFKLDTVFGWAELEVSAPAFMAINADPPEEPFYSYQRNPSFLCYYVSRGESKRLVLTNLVSGEERIYTFRFLQEP